MGILGRKRDSTEPRLMDVTARMQGSLVFQEAVNLRISGRFEGTLETRGNLTIGEGAWVQADITGEEITVAGKVTGRLVAKGSLKISRSAVLKGEIWTPILEVEQGGRLEGAIHMLGEAEGMTAEEVAAYLEVESGLIEQWAAEGKIPAAQKEGQWRFEKAKIDGWIAAQKSS